MNGKNRQNPKSTGSSLVLVVLGVLILIIMGGGLLNLQLQGQLLGIRTGSEIKARAAADAGLEKAVFSMNQILSAKAWSNDVLPWVTDESLPNCDATFGYKIVARSLSGPKSEFRISSIGKSGRTSRTVSAVVGLKSLFDSAILVQDRISLMPNTLVAAYNSADPTDTDLDLKIGTISVEADRIPLGPGTVIDGDVFVGVGGNPKTVIGAGGTITGEKYALTEEVEFPVINPPVLPDMGTGLDAKGSTITLKPSSSGTYTNITLAQAAGTSGILEITGGEVRLHITGDVDLGQGCELIIDPDSSLILYVDGDISADNSGGLNNEAGDVKDFQIYATGSGTQVLDIKAKSKIFGTIYAPQADISIYAGSEICGAIVGKSVTFKSGCTFYYDEALKDVTVFDEGVRFVVKRWLGPITVEADNK